MKPVVIDLFKGHRFLPNFAVMQAVDEYTSPEIAIEIKTCGIEIPPLHVIYEDISEDSSSIQDLFFDKVLPYYYDIVTRDYTPKIYPRILALVITHDPVNETAQ